MSKANIRDVDVKTTVDVECCEHCHGDPGDCPGSRMESDPVAAVADAASIALDLLKQAYSFIATESFDAWRRECLLTDLRQFLIGHCHVPLAVRP